MVNIPDTIEKTYIEIGKRYVSEVKFQETLRTALDGSYNFAAKKKGTKKNCNPAKSHFCQTPNGSGSCVSLSKKCRFQPTGAAKQAANYVGQQVNARVSPKPAPQIVPRQSPTVNTITVGPTVPTKGLLKGMQPTPERDSYTDIANPNDPTEYTSPIARKADRDQIVQAVQKQGGDKFLSQVEANVKRILSDTDLFIRVDTVQVLESIIDDGRFKNGFEPGLQTINNKKSYKIRRVESERDYMGYPPNTPPEMRPIYGYFGRDAVNDEESGAMLLRYGNIAVRLKPEARQRATFSNGDSIGGIYPSPPDRPDVTSLVGSASLKNSSPAQIASKLKKALAAKDAGDLANLNKASFPGAPTWYIEAQIHGQVRTSDIAEIVFFDAGTDKPRPSQKILQWAQANGVKITTPDE